MARLGVTTIIGTSLIMPRGVGRNHPRPAAISDEISVFFSRLRILLMSPDRRALTTCNR